MIWRKRQRMEDQMSIFNQKLLDPALPAREYLEAFREQQKPFVGEINEVLLMDGRSINLNNMTDEEAEEAAEAVRVVGTPTRLGNLMKSR